MKRWGVLGWCSLIALGLLWLAAAPLAGGEAGATSWPLRIYVTDCPDEGLPNPMGAVPVSFTLYHLGKQQGLTQTPRTDPQGCVTAPDVWDIHLGDTFVVAVTPAGQPSYVVELTLDDREGEVTWLPGHPAPCGPDDPCCPGETTIEDLVYYHIYYDKP